MSLPKGILMTFIVSVVVATISASSGPGQYYGSTFRVKSVDARYGYLRHYGYYAPAKLDLLEFSLYRSPGNFLLLSDGRVQETYSRRCLGLVTDTNQQIILTNCYSADVSSWYILPTRQGKRYLVNYEFHKCLSPWNYHNRKPDDVIWVPGLDDCREYNQLILEFNR